MRGYDFREGQGSQPGVVCDLVRAARPASQTSTGETLRLAAAAAVDSLIPLGMPRNLAPPPATWNLPIQSGESQHRGPRTEAAYPVFP